LLEKIRDAKRKRSEDGEMMMMMSLNNDNDDDGDDGAVKPDPFPGPPPVFENVGGVPGILGIPSAMRLTELSKRERLSVENKIPRAPLVPTVAMTQHQGQVTHVAKKAKTREELVEGRRGSINNGIASAVDIGMLQDAGGALAEPAEIVALPSGAIRSLKTYSEQFVSEEDPLAAFVIKLAPQMEPANNTGDDIRNSDALRGGVLPSTHEDIMRLVRQEGRLERALATMRSAGKTHAPEIQLGITQALAMDARNQALPPALRASILGMLPRDERETTMAGSDVTRTSYATLEPAEKGDIRALFESADHRAVEASQIELLKTIHEKAYVHDCIPASGILSEETKRLFKQAMREHDGATVGNIVALLLETPPTHRHGIDVTRLATNDDEGGVASLNTESISEAISRVQAMAHAGSAMMAALLEDEAVHIKSRRSTFSTRMDATAVAAAGASEATQPSVPEITFEQFQDMLRQSYHPIHHSRVRPCVNAERCQCRVLAMQHLVNIFPESAPNAAAMNGFEYAGRHVTKASRAAAAAAAAADGGNGVGVGAGSGGYLFVGRELLTPAETAEMLSIGGDEMYTKTGPVPRPCLLCHWKEVNDIYHASGVDMVNIKSATGNITRPVNYVSVRVGPGSFSPDQCLPILKNGRPTGIAGFFPIYSPSKLYYARVSISIPEHGIRDAKIQEIRIDGMDFRLPSQN
jgi:hypothetical protein